MLAEDSEEIEQANNVYFQQSFCFIKISGIINIYTTVNHDLKLRNSYLSISFKGSAHSESEKLPFRMITSSSSKSHSVKYHSAKLQFKIIVFIVIIPTKNSKIWVNFKSKQRRVFFKEINIKENKALELEIANLSN